MVTGELMDIEAGPNWDDDLGGSPLYAENDFNLQDLTPQEREGFFELERIVHLYLPRICNHCLNAGCVAACPAGAIYKRGEDGVVLVNQDKCRAWRMCISGCPYKKVYYNWGTGKSEKCILCFPQIGERAGSSLFPLVRGPNSLRRPTLSTMRTGFPDAVAVPDDELVEAHRDHHPGSLRSRGHRGRCRERNRSLCGSNRPRSSPVYKFVKAVEAGAPASSRGPHASHALLRSSASPGHGDEGERQLRDRR